ncbi:MAG: hypothetical protein KTR26_17025 [Flammeovirgaceae bacterium]|nr:hypothetical protein [Flammeovirgaceae bacterium]
MESEIIYIENQRFRSEWLWGVLLPTTSIFVYGAIRQVISGIPFDLVQMDDYLLVLTSVFLLGLVFLFYKMELETVIKEDGIYLNFWLIQSDVKFIPFSEICTYKAITYNPMENGGRGITKSKNGQTFSISGVKGIALHLLDGSNVIIGTQDPEDFIRSLNKLRIHN